ncbi:uncharacterized protein LOC115631676 [Scaptodrosophila lebanonensis]|uniref:Uncharacterized protein LOC115631676 n=1 Tax=Drosophila lebanonensis TaxID=7225 RepID=A0A6J2U7Q5_DROLE|nr:uncharacterized protein LOC115631676 [Scaptodrosophila lebanonensis]
MAPPKKPPYQNNFERSKNWGKVKFKPNVGAMSNLSVQGAAAMLWKDVKNDIINDEREQRHAMQVDMGSDQAKKCIKQREHNHRRNQIESKRSQPTKWESFEDNAGNKKQQFQHKANKQAKPKVQIPTLDPKNLTYEQRNYFRRKLTKATIKAKGTPLKNVIHDFKQYGVLRRRKE